MSKLDLSILIKERIESYNKKIVSTVAGKLISFGDGIANVVGLQKVRLGEILSFPKGLEGLVLSLDKEFISVILLGPYSHLREGDLVKPTNKIAQVNVGDELLGRIVDPLGEAIDGGEKISTKNKKFIESDAPNIMSRQSVNEPIETGILSIDSMIPIGKGQRELIVGDRKTGKTALCIDMIINQKGKGVKCIYVSIGQKNSSLSLIAKKLKRHNSLEYTTIVSANSSDSNSLQYLAPFSAMSIAEYWMYKGESVIVFFDDLSKHAVAYRSLTLLLRRPPGREAYPGDVFYLHSRLLERAAKLNKENGGGSITAIPIIETKAGDISSYIPTNVISITDGQLFLLSDWFNSGQRPAIDPGYSVSRVGSAAQLKLIKKFSSSLKLELANYNELKSFSEFSSELDEETKNILSRGQKILELLKQKQYKPLKDFQQIFILISIFYKIIDVINFEKIETYKNHLLKLSTVDKNLIMFSKKIKSGNLSEDEENQLVKILKEIAVKIK